MPTPGSRHAPDFNSKDPEELKEFLEKFEELAKSCCLIEKEKAKVVVKYVDKEMKAYWKRMEGYDKEWGKLKDVILDGYLTLSLDSGKPTVAQLVKIMKSYKKGKIEDEEELDTYCHKFWIIVSDLVEAKVIDEKWRDEYFWKGLPRKLLASCNASFESEDVPSMKDAIKAGGFVLRRAVARGGMKRLKEKKRVMESSDEESSEDDMESSGESEDERKMKKGKEKGDVRTKVVQFEEEGKGLQEKVDELTRKLLQLDVKDNEYTKAYAQLFLIDPIVTSHPFLISCGKQTRTIIYSLHIWADHVTTQKSTGMTPYYAVHGVEPLHPFDITKATFLASSITHHLSDSELLTVHARMLQKCNEDLVQIHDKVLATQYASIHEFKKKNANHIHNYDFSPGELVLVLNKKIKPDVGHKCKPQYFGPMVVVKWLHSRAYILAEVNGAISHLKFTAFHIIPYHPQSHKHLEITKFVDPKDLGRVEDNDMAGSGVVDEGN
ncbi:hypothetical protein AN958_11543 [Leucoagaricus sp. SymC.cos]|nr:hypothetical protein AN958_11543 [Leucoagaricus sp. SymC.cos]